MNEEQLIAELISLGSGHSVDLFCRLSVQELDSFPEDWKGKRAFSVWLWDDAGEIEREDLFQTAQEAAAYFIQRRRELKLGYEYEKETL